MSGCCTLPKKGILLAIMAGIAIMFFYGLVVKSLDPQYVAGGTGTLTPYTGVFFFAVGILASTPIFNTFAMKHPVEGKAVTMKDYFAGGRTPTYVGDVSDGVQRLIAHPTNGIFHICGVECMSIAEIAYQVADYMGLDHSFIHPVTTEEMNETTPRPRFSGMSIDKARTMLGYEPQKLKEVLANWEHL